MTSLIILIVQLGQTQKIHGRYFEEFFAPLIKSATITRVINVE